jgi:hypothetical protein
MPSSALATKPSLKPGPRRNHRDPTLNARITTGGVVVLAGH